MKKEKRIEYKRVEEKLSKFDTIFNGIQLGVNNNGQIMRKEYSQLSRECKGEKGKEKEEKERI